MLNLTLFYVTKLFSSSVLLEVNRTCTKTLQNSKLLYQRIVASIFKSYFANLVSALDIKHQKTYRLDPDPVINTIRTFENHSSISKAKRYGF